MCSSSNSLWAALPRRPGRSRGRLCHRMQQGAAMTDRRAKRLVVRDVMVAAALLFVAGPARAQTPAPAGDPTIQALLGEVRALRVAMEQMASAGPRIQLFTARLQLQETRVNNMIRRLDDVRDRLTGLRLQ